MPLSVEELYEAYMDIGDYDPGQAEWSLGGGSHIMTYDLPGTPFAEDVYKFFGGEGTITDTVHNDVVYTITKLLADTASISEAPAFSFTRAAFTDSVTIT